jgi:hypothetical protein
MEKLNLDKNNLRKFGIVMGIAFLVITLLILIRHRHSIAPAFIISAMFFISALFAPLLLKPIYIFWMRLAFILSWVNTRLILLVIFYLVFTPIGLAMRLFGVDLLERRMERNRKSYWRQKEKHKFDRLNYERQF